MHVQAFDSCVITHTYTYSMMAFDSCVITHTYTYSMILLACYMCIHCACTAGLAKLYTLNSQFKSYVKTCNLVTTLYIH